MGHQGYGRRKAILEGTLHGRGERRDTQRRCWVGGNALVAVGWRIWAWAELLKVWASLRWSDLQATIPDDIAIVEGRLTTMLRRTKTTGASRRIRTSGGGGRKPSSRTPLGYRRDSTC